MRPQPFCAKLAEKLSGLEDLSRAELIDRYRELLKCPPPKGLSRRLLMLSIGYEMQSKRYGSRRPKKRIAFKGASETASNGPNGKLRPGTRLIREWKGASHVVEVTEAGFVWNGCSHRSLSAVARAITGARWSGPRFFGLTSNETS